MAVRAKCAVLALVAAVLPVAIVPGCRSADVRGARSSVDRLIEADNRRDLDAAVFCYGRDAVLVPPAGAEIRGREAIRAHYAGIFAAFRPALRVEHLAAAEEDGAIVDRGRTRGSVEPLAGDVGGAGGPPRVVDDAYEATLRVEDGSWRVVRLAWRPFSQEARREERSPVR